MSPEDRQVAVQVETPDGADAWILDLARDTSTRLTFDPATSGAFPTWTPDGRRVAFGGPPLSWKAADGTGAVEPLVERDGRNRRPQAFSSDGSVLVFEDFEQRDFGVLSLEGDRSPSILWESLHYERLGYPFNRTDLGLI